MGFYKVLSKPVFEHLCPTYKGLYRCGPHGPDMASDKYVTLWEKYIKYYESGDMGISKQLSAQELYDLAGMCNKLTGDKFEVIWFDSVKECPHPSVYYGIDVTSFGGYSILGEGLFNVNGMPHDAAGKIFRELNCFYGRQLNRWGLFDRVEIAEQFCQKLHWLNRHMAGVIEDEDWRVVHIFKLHRDG